MCVNALAKKTWKEEPLAINTKVSGDVKYLAKPAQLLGSQCGGVVSYSKYVCAYENSAMDFLFGQVPCYTYRQQR